MSTPNPELPPAMYLRCAWCDWVTPAVGIDAFNRSLVQSHVEECTRHPLHAARGELHRLRQSLEAALAATAPGQSSGLPGSSDPASPPDSVNPTSEQLTLDGIAAACNGRIEEVGVLPDGSGFATMSMPLPAGHWLTQPGSNVPPMPWRLGASHPRRQECVDALRSAGRYAIRCATANGTLQDFGPDALLQNLVVGLFGYWTDTGLSFDNDANPNPVPPEFRP